MKAPPVPPMPTRVTRSNTLPGGEGVSRKSSVSSSRSDAPSYPGERLGSFEFELKRIRVKVNFNNDVRGMVIPPDLTFSEFLERVCAKFNYEIGGLRLKFEDEDGTKVSLRDEGDWDMAVETVRDSGGVSSASSSAGSVKPGEGRLIIWCEEDYP